MKYDVWSMKYGKRRKDGGLFPGDGGENETREKFNEGVLEGEAAFAEAAPATLKNKTYNGDELKPPKRCATRKAVRAPGKFLRVIAKRHDIEKTPDHRPKRKEEKEENCGHGFNCTTQKPLRLPPEGFAKRMLVRHIVVPRVGRIGSVELRSATPQS